MASPIRIVADVAFDPNQIQQAGQATAKPALTRLTQGLSSATKPFSLLITADSENATQIVQQFASQVDTSLTGAETRVQQFGKTLAGIGAVGVGVGGLLTAIGSGEQAAAQQLEQAIANTGDSIANYQDKIDQAKSTEEGFAHTHEETDQALQTLVQSYGNTDDALKRLQLATDLAAARHISLASAADVVAKVHGGATRALKPFDIQVRTNADGSKDLEGALDDLSAKVSGQASASVDTFTGHLKVLGTELKDRAAEFGQEYGPAILIGSTALTAFGSITSAVATKQAARAAAQALEVETTQAQIIADEAATAAEAERLATAQATTAAVVESAAADGAAIVSTEELSAAYVGLAAAEEGVAVNSAASVEGLYAQSAAMDTAKGSSVGLIGALGPLAIGAAIGAGIYAIGDAVGLIHDRFQGWSDAVDAVDKVDGSLKTLFADASQFNGLKLAGGLQDAARQSDEISTAFLHTGTTTNELAGALLHGGDEWTSFADKVEHGKNVTDEDRIAIGKLTTDMEGHAKTALDAAVANGQVSQSTLDAAEAANQFPNNGGTNMVATLQYLADKGYIAQSAVDAVADSSKNGPDDTKAKALATWYQAIADNATKAEEATLKLAPADIRVQRGQLTIADDQRAIADAEAKVKWLKASGASTQDIAKAEDELHSKRLDLEQATLDQAQAETELATQTYAAQGVTLTTQQQTDIYNASLGKLVESYNGPVRDAMATYLWNATAIVNIDRQRAELQQILAGNAPSLHVPGGGESTGPRQSSGAPGPRAAGGPVGPGEMFYGAEQSAGGYEILLHEGTYQAPPTGGYVLNHSQSEQFLAARTSSSGGYVHHGDINVIGYDDPMVAVRHMPDELRAAAMQVVG